MRNWTTKELAYIRKKSLLAETNQVLNAKELASKLQRSIKSVEMKIYAMQRDSYRQLLMRVWCLMFF